MHLIVVADPNSPIRKIGAKISVACLFACYENGKYQSGRHIYGSTLGLYQSDWHQIWTNTPTTFDFPVCTHPHPYSSSTDCIYSVIVSKMITATCVIWYHTGACCQQPLPHSWTYIQIMGGASYYTKSAMLKVK